jgi:hypothetical protein
VEISGLANSGEISGDLTYTDINTQIIAILVEMEMSKFPNYLHITEDAETPKLSRY